MVNQLRLASPLQFDSIVDGPGVRIVVWTQGCIHQCKNCHNQQTWDAFGGEVYHVDELVEQIQEANLQTGITFSGGEPFLQAENLLPLANVAKEKKYSIWAYSGFLFEDLIKDAQKKELLSYLDILVDGKFIEELKDYRLVFKGSKNQRIIDVQESLKRNEVVISTYDERNQKLGL
ncbi:anaerobic ribonucleoside-triphosphate reductase activating protein [Amedibacillus sp. YH-ame10]